MEDCECGPLRQCQYLVNRWRAQELSAIASCCLLALDFLHSRSVMHGVVIQLNSHCIEHQSIESVLNERWGRESR